MNMVIGDRLIRPDGGLTVSLPLKYQGKKTYAFGAPAYIAGAAIDWLKDGIGIISSAKETQAMAQSVPDTNGVFFVPAFNGLAAPWWDQNARGTMVGLTAGVRKEHIVRAVLESIAFQVMDNIDAMRKNAGVGEVRFLKADGGPVENEFLMQFQADILGCPVEIPNEKETSAYGAAFLAALAVGDFDRVEDARSCLKIKKRYEPNMSDDERESLKHNWHRAVERSRNWAE